MKNIVLNSIVVIILIKIQQAIADATDFNQVNNDGSFAFGLSNNDIGGHYHTASGAAATGVSGRYGSRNPATGVIEETVYTAGPRGFQPQGPQVKRRHNLSQISVGTIPGSDADPLEDPSYNFGVNTFEYQKAEDADSLGNVKGQYSYLDDVGEKHNVQYQAGSTQGFQVTNSVPDSPANVGFQLPLYKSDRNTRGKIAFERGPQGEYKFLSSGPDQRRSESTGSDGITRGSYSYLDDEGVQRTVEYVAGPGIGYRIISNQIGPGSHQPPFNQGNPNLLPSPGSTLLPPANSFNPSPSPFQPSPTVSNELNNSDDNGNDFTPLPPSNTGGSSFYDPAYRDIEGLKPPTVYNPYEGAYKSFFGTIASTPAAFIPPPPPPSPSPPAITFLPPKTFPGDSGGNYGSPAPPPSPFSGPAVATFAPPFGWQHGPKYPAQVINVDLFLPGRAPSPGDALRRETIGAFRSAPLPPPEPSSPYPPSQYGEVLRYAAQTNAVQSDEPERYAARVQEIPRFNVQATPVPQRYAGNIASEHSSDREGHKNDNRHRGSVTNCERYNNEFNCSVRKQRNDGEAFKHKKRNIVVEKRKQQQEAQKIQKAADDKN